ncbi:hypothetical protein NL676_038854 [Syzygium grande]|nr:hypothetical protein NL676_038854 [Syzygium grande]
MATHVQGFPGSKPDRFGGASDDGRQQYSLPPSRIVLTSRRWSGFRPLGARNQWFSGLLSRVSSSGSPELGEVRSRFAMASSGDGEKRREPQDATGPRSSIDTSSVECGPSSRVSKGAAEEIGMAERLTDVFVGEATEIC